MPPPTQDDLAAGRALDALVAQVMGWQRVHGPGGGCQRDNTCPAWHWGPVPAYSSDIGAAWQIIEFMRGQGLRPVLMPDWGKQWQCVVYRQDQYVCQSEWFDSAPLAICRAALAAVSAQP